MLNKTQLHRLLDLVIKVHQETYSYVNFKLSNFRVPVYILIYEDGFGTKCNFDAEYFFSKQDTQEESDKKYNDCIARLNRLLKEKRKDEEV